MSGARDSRHQLTGGAHRAARRANPKLARSGDSLWSTYGAFVVLDFMLHLLRTISQASSWFRLKMALVERRDLHGAENIVLV